MFALCEVLVLGAVVVVSSALAARTTPPARTSPAAAPTALVMIVLLRAMEATPVVFGRPGADLWPKRLGAGPRGGLTTSLRRAVDSGPAL